MFLLINFFEKQILVAKNWIKKTTKLIPCIFLNKKNLIKTYFLFSIALLNSRNVGKEAQNEQYTIQLL